MSKVLDARFVTTAVHPEQYPRPEFPEIAFVGRSNVGKSSMINALAGRRKLVRVSNTPGRTRTLNFFDVDLEWEGRRETVRLTDLPGYGFAKASKTDRRSWQAMIDAYVDKRRILRAIVAIIDAEVGPTDQDQETIDWLSEKPPKILVVATKIDRLVKARRKPRRTQLARQLGLPEDVVFPFSSTEPLGVEDVWDGLLRTVASAG